MLYYLREMTGWLKEKQSYSESRRRLVDSLKREGIVRSEAVERAMLKVPREMFLPPSFRDEAYLDTPLPIGYAQTISAPHMCAILCEYMELKEGQKVLEIGTGSGYQAALLAEIVAPSDSSQPGHVYSVEVVQKLVSFSTGNLERTGYSDVVTVVYGDGSLGYPEKQPYDKVVVTAAAPMVPSPLIEQLKDGGRLLIPLEKGFFMQELYLVEKKKGREVHSALMPVAFVPLRGRYGSKP